MTGVDSPPGRTVTVRGSESGDESGPPTGEGLIGEGSPEGDPYSETVGVLLGPHEFTSEVSEPKPVVSGEPGVYVTVTSATEFGTEFDAKGVFGSFVNVTTYVEGP